MCRTVEMGSDLAGRGAPDELSETVCFQGISSSKHWLERSATS